MKIFLKISNRWQVQENINCQYSYRDLFFYEWFQLVWLQFRDSFHCGF